MEKWKTHNNNDNNPQDNNDSRDFDLYRLSVIGKNNCLEYEFIDCYPKWIYTIQLFFFSSRKSLYLRIWKYSIEMAKRITRHWMKIEWNCWQTKIKYGKNDRRKTFHLIIIVVDHFIYGYLFIVLQCSPFYSNVVVGRGCVEWFVCSADWMDAYINVYIYFVICFVIGDVRCTICGAKRKHTTEKLTASIKT